MIRVLMIVAAMGWALAACQQPAPSTTQPASKTHAAKAAAPKADVTVVAYAPDPADRDGDAASRGPMSVQESSGADGLKRYRFTWMNGAHTVIVSQLGSADGQAVIDTIDNKPLTLAQSLGAQDGETIQLLAVENESGPMDDPDFTPICGIREVEYFAFLQRGESLALATSVGNFGGPGARGCSNLMLYKKAS